MTAHQRHQRKLVFAIENRGNLQALAGLVENLRRECRTNQRIARNRRRDAIVIGIRKHQVLLPSASKSNREVWSAPNTVQAQRLALFPYGFAGAPVERRAPTMAYRV